MESNELMMAKRDMKNLYGKANRTSSSWRSELELDKLVILQKINGTDRNELLAYCLELEDGL